MQTIAIYSYPYEAHIARAKLESENIPAFVVDEHTINAQWLYSNALGGVKLQVPDSTAATAIEILSEDNTDELVALLGEDKLICPDCGSNDLNFFTKGKRMAFFIFIITDFPLWPYKRQFKCLTCGKAHSYKT